MIVFFFLGSLDPIVGGFWYFYGLGHGHLTPTGAFGLSRWCDLAIQPFVVLTCLVVGVIDDRQPVAWTGFRKVYQFFVIWVLSAGLIGFWRGFGACLALSLPAFLAFLLIRRIAISIKPS
jgi:hypothetical protein